MVALASAVCVFLNCVRTRWWLHAVGTPGFPYGDEMAGLLLVEGNMAERYVVWQAQRRQPPSVRRFVR